MLKYVKFDLNNLHDNGDNAKIYLAEYNNKKYIVRYRGFSDKDYKDLLINNYGPFNTVNKLNYKYPNYFTILYDYKIKKKNYNLKKITYNYTLIEMYEYIPYLIRKYLFNKIYFNLFTQIIYILYILDIENIVYPEAHDRNFGLIKTNKKYIKIFNYKIPTNGYFVKLFDYDDIIEKKWPNYKTQLNNGFNCSYGSIFFLLFHYTLLINTDNFYNYYKFNNNYEIKYSDKIIIPKKYVQKLIKYLPKVEINDIVKKFLLQFLFKIKYTKKYQKLLLQDKFEKYIEFQYLIPKNIIKFIVKNANNIKSILLFLIFYKNNR